MEMDIKSLTFLFKRILVFLVTMFLTVSLIFAIFRMMPGDPLGAFLVNLGQQYSWRIEGGQELIMEYRKAFGLDQDLWTQYVSFLKRFFLELDFGPSFLDFPRKSNELIFKALPYSLGLLGVAVVISWSMGNLIGVFVGWRRGSKIDTTLFTVALGLSQIPYYFLAIFLMLLLAYIIPLLPTGGAWAPTVKPGITLDFIISFLRHAILPSMSVVLASLSGWLISMRSLIITILGEDYLIFARAKGLKKSRILMKYALRNALLPQVTGLAMSLGFSMNGFLLVESIFLYPGIGTLFIRSLNYMDYNTALGCTILTTITVLAASLVIELLYPFIDPRVKLK